MTEVTEVGAAGESQDLDEMTNPARRPGRHRPGRRGLLAIAVVLAVVLVAGAAVALVMAGRVRAFDSGQRDRADVQAVAQQFAMRMDNFDSAKLDRYAGSIEKLLTTKAKTKFDPAFKQFAKVYAQGHVRGSGHVLTSGVGDIDQDSATALVVHDMTAKSDLGTQVHHYRWTVTLAKVHGRWLVDDFNEVG